MFAWLDARWWYGNTVGEWLAAAAVIALCIAIIRGSRWLVRSKLKSLAERSANHWDNAAVEVFSSTSWLLHGAVIGLGLISVVELPPDGARIIGRVALVMLLVQLGLYGDRFLRCYMQIYRERRLADDAASVMAMSALVILAEVALWASLLLAGLANFGVDVTALVAGLGIGGIAVALALQNVLGDLFAALAIVLDKPFVLGDFLIVGDYMGNVERIGLKTTRIRSLSGEQIVFSNSDLIGSRIRNYKRMIERRVVFTVGVVYGTPPDQLERAVTVLREAVEARELARFDRAHFKRFADSALELEVVYYVLSSDFNVYMDIQQAINLEIVRRFEQLDIELAFPTRTVHLAPGTRDEIARLVPREPDDEPRPQPRASTTSS